MIELLDSIKSKIRRCIEKLYAKDAELFTRNNSQGLCERCLVFRFALYLQEAFSGYFVDCDFNSHSEMIIDSNNQAVYQADRNGKPIQNSDGSVTGRFVDIIIHRRSFDRNNDFICFEVKKWNNNRRSEAEKDKNNLKSLTRDYGYRYGFFLVLGQTIEKTEWEIYENGVIIEDLRQATAAADLKARP